MLDNKIYAVVKPCGCVVAAAAGSGWHHEIAAWIKAGENVQQVTADYVRAHWGGKRCPHDPAQQTLPIQQELFK